MTIRLRDYQSASIDAVWAFLEHRQGNPAVVLPTGCHAPGTLILMADGSTKAVELVEVGDSVMGPDSTPRRVLRLAHGTEPMYRITPKRGEAFDVNAGHILFLQTTNEGKPHKCCTTGGEVNTISVSDYLLKSKSWRHLRKLRRGWINFPTRERPDLDPWALGALLGDGHLKNGIKFSKPDVDILNAIWAEMERHGLKYSANERGGAWHVGFRDPESSCTKPNRVTAILRQLGVAGCDSGNKFVPDCYKLGSRQDRLDILAGLLDTDGHLSRSGYDYISKSRQLSTDVVFIARSLGLAAYMSECRKGCQTGAVGTYWRVSINGDTDVIPMRCVRKKAPPRKQKKNPLVTGFSVTPIGVGEFYGFQLDGDHLYLTADFTVHHNSGKTIVLAGLIQQALTQWPGTRIAVVAHVRELVAQNAQKMIAVWPEAPIGIYSASLRRRDTQQPVLFASIQSVYNRAGELGRFDIVLVDEAHRIPVKGEGMYRQFLADCKRFNPQLRVVGLTATPYRLGVGPVCAPENLLTDICYEVYLKELIDQGYLSRLISKASVQTRIDTSAVHVRGGEFVAKELEAAVNQVGVVASACREMVTLLADRRAWIVFCAGVDHAEAVNAELGRLGIASAVVEGKLSTYDRDARISAFQRGQVRALCNVNVLTEGFDATHVDAVVMLRPTKSPGLYVQMVGRGLRLHPGKTDCLVLDFAGNILEHGPVDAIKVSKPRTKDGEATLEKQPMKACPSCSEAVAVQVTVCPNCGHRWPVTPPHQDSASMAAILSDEAASIVQTHAVDDVYFDIHAKAGSPQSLKVTYRCGLRIYREWICLEHSGFARSRAVTWWRNRALLVPEVADVQLVPPTVERALDLIDHLPTPARIRVRESGKYPEILHAEFDPRPDPVPQVGSDRAPEGCAGRPAGDADADPVHGVRALPARPLQQVVSPNPAGASWPWLR